MTEQSLTWTDLEHAAASLHREGPPGPIPITRAEYEALQLLTPAGEHVTRLLGLEFVVMEHLPPVGLAARYALARAIATARRTP